MKNLIIDVREISEFKSSHVDGSVNAPLSNTSLNLTNLINSSQAEKITLLCRSGKRAEMALETLDSKKLTKPVSVFKGGILAWNPDEIVSENTLNEPMPIIRQVQIMVGSIITIFGVLSFIKSDFIIVPTIMGFGLAFSGLTGNCMAASFLSKMPWNKKD